MGAMVASPLPDRDPATELPFHVDVDSAFSVDLDLAVELAHLAGRLQAERYEQLIRVDAKGGRDVVTEVDYGSEELILSGIHGRYPRDGLLAEESGEGRSKTPIAETSRVWIVDPLDGTINYANGIPFYCVSIALAIDGLPVVGVVHDPSRGETFSATADGPALLDDGTGGGPRPIHASTKESLSELVVTMAIGGRGNVGRRRRLLRCVRAARSMGSAALTLCYVGNGRFDAYGQGPGLSAWDVAAAGLIAERAGATVTDVDGGPWFDLAKAAKRWTLLAAAPAHHGRLLELLHGERPDPAPPSSDGARDPEGTLGLA